MLTSHSCVKNSKSFYTNKPNQHKKELALLAMSLLSSSSRRFSNRRLSSCALAAITFLSSSLSTESWSSSASCYATGSSSLSSRRQQQQQQNAVKMSTSSLEPSTTTCSLTVSQFPCRSDNYGYLVHDPLTGQTAAIDTPCGRTYKEELERRGWKLTHILNTHHHHDHVGGNLELKTDGVTIIGPKDEKHKIPGIDFAVGEGDTVKFGNQEVTVMDGGGHTSGHIMYYFPEESSVFTGDCLFSLGCGKMFEGNPKQFWRSLATLRDLPDDTLVYCAHEYTQSNGKFAMSVEPGNANLQARVEVVRAKRSRNEPTVPSLLGEEKKANPFLRVDFSEEIRKNIGVNDNDTPADAFGKLRKAKDNF